MLLCVREHIVLLVSPLTLNLAGGNGMLGDYWRLIQVNKGLLFPLAYTGFT